MQDVELYADLISSLAHWAHMEVEGLSEEELTWQPDAQANTIAVTVWHFSRWLDVTARILQGKPRREELWLTHGWAERTGYNPQGIGYQGLGVVTGYTLEEVAAVPLLSAQDLLVYLDEVCKVLGGYLRSLSSAEVLHQLLPSTADQAPLTKQQLLQTVFMGACGHMGEIEALKAMMKRTRAGV